VSILEWDSMNMWYCSVYQWDGVGMVIEIVMAAGRRCKKI
jgi:hypothetical protein